MTNFARPAGWLRELFTASRTEFSNPNVLSSDVSLVQPYDGGGYAVEHTMWYHTASSVAGISATTNIGPPIPANSIGRILACGILRTVTNNPSIANLLVLPPGGAEVAISRSHNAVTGNVSGLDGICPIVGPGYQIRGYHGGGSASTEVDWRILLCVVPLGTVFYV